MKKILAYSLMLFFVAALVAPVASFADDDFPTNKGQRAAEGSDPKEDAKESSSVVATGIACDACEKNAVAGNIYKPKKKNRENFEASKGKSDNAPSGSSKSDNQ